MASRHPLARFLSWMFRWLVRGVIILALVWAGLYGLARWTLTDLDRADPARAIDGRPDIALVALRRPALEIVAQIHDLRQPHTAPAGPEFSDCDICPTLVEIPAGHALIGSPLTDLERYRHLFVRPPLRAQLPFINREGPRRLVSLPRSLAVATTELTLAQWTAAQQDPDWQAVTGRAPRIPQIMADIPGDHAVTGLDWYDAQAYVSWLSHRTGQRYRLPSDAEWEYAARAGSAGRFFWGNSLPDGQAACADCGTGPADAGPGQVARFAPNAFGLYDMHGNGWEWVEDCYAPYHDPVKRSGAAHVFKDCEFRIIRGGSGFDESWKARSSTRVGPHPDNAEPGSVIRVVREMP